MATKDISPDVLKLLDHVLNALAYLGAHNRRRRITGDIDQTGLARAESELQAALDPYEGQPTPRRPAFGYETEQAQRPAASTQGPIAKGANSSNVRTLMPRVAPPKPGTPKRAPKKPPVPVTHEKALWALIESMLVAGGACGEVSASEIVRKSPAGPSTTYRYLRKFIKEGKLVVNDGAYARAGSADRAP